MINRSKMRRQLYSNGGNTRQHYGLGSLVKKAIKSVTKPFKQILKSDAGKAALLGAGLYGLGGGTFFGKGFPGMGGGFSMQNILPNLKNLGTAKQIVAGTGAALAFGEGDPTKTEGFDMAKRKGDVESYLRRYYREYKKSDWQTGWTQDEEDDFVNRYTSEYNQGGRVGLQTGGQPVVDERMKNTLAENVRMNNLQKEMNERVKKGSKTGGLELRNRYIPGGSGGITGIESGARMYGINPPQNYNLYNPSLTPNEAQLFASYRNQGLNPNQIKAISYFDAMEGRGAANRLSPLPSPHDPLFMGNIFKSEPELDAQYQEGLRRSMLEGSPEIYWDQGSKEYKLHDSEYLRNLYNQPSQFEQLSGYKTEKEAIDAMGIEKYNQLMSKGGRVGLYAGSPDPDDMETLSTLEIMSDQGIPYGEQVKREGIKSLEAGAPDLRRMGNMETKDSQLVKKYMEHKQESDVPMSFDEFEKYQSMTAYGGPFSALRKLGFKSHEISNLFKNLSQMGEKYKTNENFKQLYRLLSNPMENKQTIIGIMQEYGKKIPKVLKEKVKKKKVKKKKTRKKKSIGGIMGGRIGLRAMQDLINENEEEYAQGGRIGYALGSNGADPERPPIYLPDPNENPENMKMAGMGGAMDFLRYYGMNDNDIIEIYQEWKDSGTTDSFHKYVIDTVNPPENYAQGGRIGYDDGGEVSDRAEQYYKYIIEMKSMGVEPVSVEEFNRMLDAMREQNAQGGRIGYRYGGGGADYTPVGSLAMNKENVPQMFISDEAGALPKIDGGVLPEDLGNLTIDDFENIEDYMRYLRMINQNNQGGRIGQMYGTGPQGLPGIPRMASDGMEFDMRAEGGFQPLGAKEGKDDVPAMLAKNEFVFTADAVRGAGDGDIEKGAQRMYDTMKNLEEKIA